MMKVDGSGATINIKNFPIGLHVMHLYFRDSLICMYVCITINTVNFRLPTNSVFVSTGLVDCRLCQWHSIPISVQRHTYMLWFPHVKLWMPHQTWFLGAFADSRKVPVSVVIFISPPVCSSVRLSVCPFTYISAAPIRSFPMKFDIWVFYENVSRKSRFG
jgi:hypothetical protein